MATIGGRLDAFTSLKLIAIPLLVVFAALALATPGHEGPDRNNDQYDANSGQDDLFVHKCVEELVIELSLLIGTCRVNFLNIHLKVCIRMILSQLLEPLVASHLLFTLLLVLKILQVLLDHIFRDFEAFRDLYACRKLEIVGQLNAFRQRYPVGQLIGLG